jgi:hypothetical protein
MSGIDNLMATCPLKQEIRVNLWEKYITKIRKKPISYLTLFSPPLVDVKHFTNRGHILLEKGVYRNVVALTLNDEEAYAKLVSEGKGRPELVKVGYLHKFIKDRDKELTNRYPFDVINFDYPNYLFTARDGEVFSTNFEDIVETIKLQKTKNANEYVIFITTLTMRSEKNADPDVGFSDIFLQRLTEKISQNIQGNSDFSQRYINSFKNDNPQNLKDNNYECFLSLGIMKLVAMELAENGYTIADSDCYWLKRDSHSEKFDLLHLAIHIKKGKPILYHNRGRNLNSLGRAILLEKGILSFFNKYDNNSIVTLVETRDQKRLSVIHSSYLEELNRTNFELGVPDSIEETP